MFDTPSFAPCCVGPLIALVVGGLALAIGMTIEKLFKKETQHRLSRFIALIIALTVCYISVSHNIGTSRPSPLRITDRGVIGTWRLSQASIEYLQHEGYTITAPEIVFEADGTFRMSNVPDVWEYMDRSPNGKYITGSGTWRVSRFQTWEVEANFQTVNGQARDISATGKFRGLWPPYTLELWWMGFYKEQANPP